ncbi:glutamate--cysteine ligase [Novacetimonas pomaceti]|uniref:Glutamate--cysteine ligase n=1 Tax=Novacetimonas pomaceti TaxID=2021998 RepID=A0A318QI10_9PROT|nr:glutamate--cysteine ligase [Novacetimonas pomaceti]MBV1833786.1 glutamate--cysteine ligase [Novacetimonas pomaceti]PYD47857.1 glutamate--cysteine ligase [Novacetimonas pomaceti]PYD77141.1 glutamate--cysteine ligase [Novacetimonas pomaceti]
MSNPGDQDTTPIESVSQLAGVLAQGAKPKDAWRIGTEHEKFGFIRPQATRPGHRPWMPPPYEPDGIHAVLSAMQQQNGTLWHDIRDKGALIGLKGLNAQKGASISLEPAGQFELSGKPLASLHETRAEMAGHFSDLHPICEMLGLGFAPLGFHPFARREDMPRMPKSRYAIMQAYMPTVGSLGLDMMLRTCTVQVNLDFASEQDMIRKMRVSLALQPVATALFANSPFYEGHPNGLLSNRAHVWTDTDNRRSGMPLEFFAPSFGFESYVEWLLDVPMYFIMRDGRIHDVAGRSFRAWMKGEYQEGLEGLTPTIGDFEDHMTTAFTDVRLKQFLEMRGADAGSPEMMLAQSALWVGILYDDAALSAADALVHEQPWTSYADLRAQVPRLGLDAPWAGGKARDLAARMVDIATDGLRARACRDATGADETRYLAPLQEIVAGGPTQAEAWLAAYHGRWNGDVTRIFDEAAI